MVWLHRSEDVINGADFPCRGMLPESKQSGRGCDTDLALISPGHCLISYNIFPGLNSFLKFVDF